MGQIARRTFLIGSTAIAGGVAFGTYRVNRTHPNPLKGHTEEGEETFNPYLKITRNNRITIMVPRAEMGQGVTTTLTALIAEELDVDMDQVQVEIAPASFAYHNSAVVSDIAPLASYNHGLIAESLRSSMGAMGKILPIQLTGGSSSVADAYDKLRQAGATAREVLKIAASRQSGHEMAVLKTGNGSVVLPDGSTLTYGSLCEQAVTIEPPSLVALRPSSDWTILGQSTPRVDARAKSTGAPIFGIDVDLPGMVHATLRMNPRLGGPMIKFDAVQARKMNGVIDVIDLSGPPKERLGGGFAVIATNTWLAFKAAEAVEVTWGAAPYPADTDDIMNVIQSTLETDRGWRMRDDGDVHLGFADAPRDTIVEAQYGVPYLAHATMEPMNATAQLKDGRLDIWTGTQVPTLVRMDCAAEAGVKEINTYVHSTYLGGGFGRRLETDFARLATRVAKKLHGHPVKLVWTREEDMTHDAYRPAAISKWRARIGSDGIPVAMDGKIAAPSVLSSMAQRLYPDLPSPGFDSLVAQGAFDQPYSIENYRISALVAPLDIPVGFWRSVGHSYNGFFQECFLDEIAGCTGLDPVDMRLALMKNHPTATGVVRKVADMAKWTTPPEHGRARGMAFSLSFGCWVAQIVEIADSGDGIRIENVWCAADIGEALDPAIVRAQLQSGIIFGLSSAMGQNITFADGMVEQVNFDSFDAMRMNQCPTMHIEILETAEHRGGAGEPGTPPSIPALANAVYALTDKRIRTLPLSQEVDFFA
jgi:isoquinoline 1-oxidoreductase beta subunit